MSRKRSSRSSARDDSASTMREVLDEVHRMVNPLDKYAHMGPGDFNDDDMTFLRHPNGELLHLAEWKLDLEDARNIVRAGADVYVNPESFSSFLGATRYESERQTWLLGADASLLHEATPLVGKNHARIRISLYKSDNGTLAVHVTGAFAWPE